MNKLSAVISNITQSANLALITLDCEFGRLHTLVIIDDGRAWEVGNKIKAIFKQTQVLVCKADFRESFEQDDTKDSLKTPKSLESLKTNKARFHLPTQNCIFSTITEIEREEILTRVECEAGISALIASIDGDELEVGQECAWFVAPSDILLEHQP